MTETRKRGFFYGWTIVAASFLVLFSECILYIYGVFFKPMINELGWSRAAASAAYSICMALYATMLMPMGWIYDRHGPRILIAVGGVIMGLGIILCSQVYTLWQLYLFFGVMIGVGLSPLYVSASSTVMKWFAKKRGLVAGIVTTGIGIGQAVMAPVSEHIIEIYNWRVSFTTLGILTLAALMVATFMVRRSPEDIGLTPYGAEDPGSSFERDLSKSAKVTADLPLHKAIRTTAFWASYFMFAFAYFALLMVMVHIVPFAIDIGIDPMSASFALSAIGISGIVGKVAVGFASDKVGRRGALIMSYGASAIMMVLLVGITNAWMLYLFAVLFGFFYGGWVAMPTPLTAELFGLTYLGANLGAITTTFGIGGALGPVIAGYIFDVTGSYFIAFFACAIIFSLAAALSFLARPPKTAY